MQLCILRRFLQAKRKMNTEIIKEIFEDSKNTKNLIGIWTYTDDSGYWSGYVKDYNDEFVQIRHYTKYGKPDGTIIEKISNIESIDYEDDYAKCLKYLIENSAELDAEKELKQILPNENNWQYEYLNNHTRLSDRILRISVKDDNTYSGFIDKIDSENVVIQLIGSLGEDEGFSMYKLEDISCIRINDIENRKRLMLYNWKKTIK